MMRRFIFLYVILFLSYGLTACSSSASPIPTMSPSPTSKVIPTISIIDPTPLMTLTSTFTKTPIITSTFTPTPTLTIIPSPTTPIETEQAQATLDAFGSLCPVQFPPSISPNGHWIVSSCKDIGTGSSGLMVTKVDGSRVWQVANNSPAIKLSGPGSLMPEHWSHDGASLYISLFPAIDGNIGNFVNGSALYKLNLSSGSITSLILGTGDPWDFYSFTVSPNDRYLAYVFEKSPFTLKILDLLSGKTSQIDLQPSCGIGQLVWSPKEDKIAYLIGNCMDGHFTGTLSLGIVTVSTSSELIIAEDLESYPFITWTDESPIVEEYQISDGNQIEHKFSIDLDNSQLVPLSP